MIFPSRQVHLCHSARKPSLNIHLIVRNQPEASGCRGQCAWTGRFRLRATYFVHGDASSHTPYPSPPRTRDGSLIPLLLLSKTNPLRWASFRGRDIAKRHRGSGSSESSSALPHTFPGPPPDPHYGGRFTVFLWHRPPARKTRIAPTTTSAAAHWV